MAKQITGADIIADARRYLGIPYKFGGGPANPRAGLDCSGLVERVCFDLGIGSCPRTSEEQWGWVKRVSTPTPGDLVFFTGAPEEAGPPGHVAFVVAPGVMLDAPHQGTSVSIQHYAPTGTGENQVVGYGGIPRVATSPSANASLATSSPSAAGSLGAVGASVASVIMLGLLILILVGVFVIGAMIAS